MEINVLIDKGFKEYLKEDWLQEIAGQVLVAQSVDANAELGLVIAGQDRVRELNLKYLGRDEPTDVLTFSAVEEIGTDSPQFVMPPDGVLHLGESIISYPQAVVQAGEHGHSVRREVAILVIHGILHLLGYDDESPESKRVMSAREAEILGDIEANERL